MTVVITGSTQGIGLAIAKAFAAEGANLALTARTGGDLQKTQEELAKDFPSSQILIYPSDMGVIEEVKAFAEKVKSTFGQVDVLVNNAALFMTGNMMDEPEENLSTMMAVNMLGPAALTRALMPWIQKSEKGHIFNICSVASQTYFPMAGSYSATKYAFLGYTRALRQELKDQGIKVTAMLPGATLSRSWDGIEVDPQRLMQADDVAQAVVAAWKLPATALVEELMMRPPLGDL
ncbi:MAG: SDR family oxidoreductase [Bacteroidota bacterium]